MAIEQLTINWADGTETTVTPLLPDTWKFEEAMKNNPRWGKLQDNLLKAQQYKAFAALKRLGLHPERTASWEEFGALVHNITVGTPDDDDDDDDELEVEGVGKGGRKAPSTTSS